MNGMDQVVRAMTEEQLNELRQGCTEFTCVYHGPYNIELARRKREAQEEDVSDG